MLAVVQVEKTVVGACQCVHSVKVKVQSRAIGVFPLQIRVPFSGPRRREVRTDCYPRHPCGKRVQLMPNTYQLASTKEFTRMPPMTESSWCHGLPLSSSPLSLRPPPAGRRGLSRRGTCGCHLMGEKQVEVKASSRFCQSTSALLSIMPVTFRGVCAPCVNPQSV